MVIIIATIIIALKCKKEGVQGKRKKRGIILGGIGLADRFKPVRRASVCQLPR